MKLTLKHLIGGGDLTRAWLDRWAPPVIVQAGEYRPELVAPVTIGALGYNLPASPDNWMWDTRRAVRAGNDAGVLVADYARANPHITHWEGANEPAWSAAWTTSQARQACELYAAYHAAFAETLHAKTGKGAALGAWAVLSPRAGWLRIWAQAVTLHLWSEGDLSRNLIYTCHAYGETPLEMSSPIRAIAAGIRDAGADPTGKIVATEAGRETIDGTGGPWRKAAAIAGNRETLYGLELSNLARAAGTMAEVLGVAVFCAGGGADWDDYRVTPDLFEQIQAPQIRDQEKTRHGNNRRALVTWRRTKNSPAIPAQQWPGYGPVHVLAAPWDVDIFDQTEDGRYLALTPERGWWAKAEDIFK